MLSVKEILPQFLRIILKFLEKFGEFREIFRKKTSKNFKNYFEKR